jgi:hypothetical protein
MRIAILVISILFALSCKTGIEYPEGGYDYVKNYKAEDTGFYYLPVRDSFSQMDSFGIAWDSKNIYSNLGEPNLSLEPVGEDVFRMTWSAALGGLYFITLKKDKITVKKMLAFDEPINNFTNCYDTAKLNPMEKMHLRVFENYFPIKERNISGRRKQFLDSLIHLYPELLNSKYYYSLKKRIYCNDLKLKYSVRTISITHEHTSIW